MSGLFSVEGKVAVVTGGSRGIGLMIARGFVEAGARVVISSRKAAVCAEVAEELSKVGECRAIAADLSTESECARLAAAIAEDERQVDILGNNAGATWGAPLAEHNEATWDRVLDLNVKGVFFMTKHLLPLLRAAGSAEEPARVVNIGSIDGLHVPSMETYSYSSSKAAVHQLTRHLAKQLAPEITVNAIAPGPFESKMMAVTLEAFGDAIAAGAPLKRIGRPDDMAGTALFPAPRLRAHPNGGALPGGRRVATRG